MAEPLKHARNPLEPPVPTPGGIAARARAGGAAPYLAGLNAEQRLAVETLDGPVLVLAGAGTGKTRVLTVRIAHILATGRARPGEILAVTFTNKAAREMKHRVGDIVGHVVEGMPWLGTFHSIGVKILRRHAEMVGLKPDFTILDVDDQIRLLKQLLAAENIDEKRWPGRVLAMLIDGWKNRGLTPEQVPAGEAAAFANGKGLKLYKAFQERLKILNAADFGDLLLENIRLFREQPEVLRQYQGRFKYILVDEYQDTNVAQYLWLRLLAQRGSAAAAVIPGRREAASPESITPAAGSMDSGLAPDGAPRNDEVRQKNICCVGDDDQSIYGWRGAEVDNILRFEHDFPGAVVIRLERNYRSTGHILAAASHLIAHNEGRLGKTLRTDDVPGEKVCVTGSWDFEEEARAIGEEIEQLQRGGPSGTPHALNEIAILVRASFQMREFEDRFVTLGMPYRVIGGPRFYERAEIRDALAYLRVINSPADDLAFERIVNVPKRGLGDATVQIIHDHARKRRVPMTEAARAIVETDELKPKARGSLRGLIDSLDRWRKQRDITAAHPACRDHARRERLHRDVAEGPLRRRRRPAGEPQGARALDGRVREPAGFSRARLARHGQREGRRRGRRQIMTLHSAKGLEFDTVFLPGWEEGVFPNQRTLDDQGRAGLEEERRLAHVGLTRARRRAKIYFATNRRMHGLWQTNIPSRFLDELPEPHVEVTESQGGFGGYGGYGASRFDAMTSFGSSYSTPGWQRAQAKKQRDDDGFAEPEAHYEADEDDILPLSRSGRGRSGEARPGEGPSRTWEEKVATDNAPRRSTPASPARRLPLTIEGELVAKSTGTLSAFTLGDRVFHQKFGNGNVTGIDGNKLTIAFDQAGEKRVVDSFVERV